MYRVKITGYDRFTGGRCDRYKYFRFKAPAVIYKAIMSCFYVAELEGYENKGNGI